MLSLSPYHPRLGEVYVSGLQLSDNDLLVNYYGAAAYLYDVNESRNTELLSRSYYRNLTSHLRKFFKLDSADTQLLMLPMRRLPRCITTPSFTNRSTAAI